jgi:tetratricopeptide (TPR) repeat protein
LDDAADAWRKGIKIYENLTVQYPHDQTYAVLAADAYHELIVHLIDRKPREKREAWERIVQIYENSTVRTILQESSTPEPVLANVLYIYARALAGVRRLRDAEQVCMKALQAIHKLDAMQPGQKTRLANLYHLHGKLVEPSGRHRDAEESYSKALQLNPQSALFNNDLAWLLVTAPDRTIHDPAQAVALARRALEIQPKAANVWNTLGVAQYRVGDYRAAIESLKKSEELAPGTDYGANAFFVAMAHWQLGDKDTAHEWYSQAAEWTDKNQPQNEELRRFREEAIELLKIL